MTRSEIFEAMYQDLRATKQEFFQVQIEQEVYLVERALQDGKDNVAHACRLIGMRRTTMWEKIKKYGCKRARGCTV